MLQQALALHKRGRLAEARSLYLKILSEDPINPDALHLLAMVELAEEKPSAAIGLLNRAIALNPKNAMLLSNCGYALQKLKLYDEAVLSCDRALLIKPDFAEALVNRGNALQALGNVEDALGSYERALALKPNIPEALIGRGAALRKLRRLDDALVSYDRALAVNHNDVEALIGRGNVFRELRRFDEALGSYARALAIKPNDSEVLVNRGNVLRDLKRFDRALANYARAMTIDPNYEFLFGIWLHCKMMVCDWSGLGADFVQLSEKIESQEKASTPFNALATPLSAASQKTCAEIYIREKYPAKAHLGSFKRPHQHGRIRLAYVSETFRDHPVALLTAGLIESHDRGRFEVIALSVGRLTSDATRARLEKSFDRFIDVDNRSDEEIAILSRSLEVDIAIDLNGLTGRNRTGLFALRAAPIQVNYLGYPGTMGADYMDYIIADATVIPEGQQHHYTEKIVYLPDTYMANDSNRRIADRTSSRTEAGLPEAGFVFCCFNNNYKINPVMFDLWMRLLKEVAHSVLWLPESNNAAMNNLRVRAKASGVDPGRLVFAPFLKNSADHLVRLKLADLFLDTLPYNAHSTAADALWAGLPVLTCLGETFPGRVAASLLKAIGLLELITGTLDEYERVAREIATNPGKLSSLKRTLATNRVTHPLFDTSHFTKQIESAYVAMCERHRSGLPPGHIYVGDDKGPCDPIP